MALWPSVGSKIKPADIKRRAEFLSSQTYVVLSAQIPKENDRTAASAEQFFAALHGILREDPIVQEHVSFELVARKDSIVFYLFVPVHLREFIESQLYAQYPDLIVSPVQDYCREVNLDGMHVATTRVKLTKEDVYPIKTYAAEKETDPLAGITAAMASLDAGEQLWMQIVAKPVGDSWQERGVKLVRAIRAGDQTVVAKEGFAKVGRVFLRLGKELIQPGAGAGGEAAVKEVPRLSAPEEAALKGIESKITKLGFQTIIRVVCIAGDEMAAKARTQALLGALKQYNTNNLNGFTTGEVKIDDFNQWEQYTNREFEEVGSIFNIEELASLYHFPTTSVEVNAISRAGSKKGEAPFNIPLREMVDPHLLTVLGKTDYRSTSSVFGVKMDDRMRHIYVIGKSGTGKSTLLENMLIDDIALGRGVIVVDPHGELADKVVDFVPEDRIDDVVLIDPADTDWPVSFNPLEAVSEKYRGVVASGFVAVLKKIFGDSWGPRLEYILRNTALALLESPNSTMMGIPRMLTDKAFCESVVAHVTDPVVKGFWKYEWAGMDQKQQSEAIGPILNKVGQFLSSSMIRNLTCQPVSTINFREAMDKSKILIVNLSKGKIGEDAMALLGSMIVTKVQLAAMSRADTAPGDRPAAFLYVDEFQNFATDSFATILSEARKYNLGLTIAHQYIAQLSDEVRDAVIGNVGSMILFRVGTPDAEALQKEFAPTFEVSDMINLERGHVYIKLLVDGFSSQPFSARAMPPKHVESIGENRRKVIEASRAKYGKTRAEAEALIDEVSGFRVKREMEEASQRAAAALRQTASTPQQAPIAPKAPVSLPDRPFSTTPPVTQTPVIQQPVQQVQQIVPAPITAQPSQLQAVEPILAPVVQDTHTEVMVAPDGSRAVVTIDDPLAGQGMDKPKKPRVEKPPKIMQGNVWREVSQRGGQRWFLGETEGEYRARKMAESTSLAPENLSETPPAS